MRIERHVFGSYKGYTTLAKSVGISEQDARDLEGGVYGFGQTEDPRYANSLQFRPAFFTRVLRGERRGLTRVLPGAPDSDGRPTNLMITAVLSCSDWNGHLRGAVSHLLADKPIWQWAGGGEITALDRNYPAPVSTISRKLVLKIVSLISEIERRWNAPTPIIVSEAEFGGEEIRAVEMLIPPKNRPQFTAACRSLGPQLAVTLNQLAAEAPLQKINFHFDPKVPASPYAEFLLENGLADGQLPIGEAITYRIFGRAEPERGPRKRTYVPPPMPAEERGHSGVLWMGAVLLVILAVAGAVVIRKEKSASHVAVKLPPSAAPLIIPPTQNVPSPSEINTARAAVEPVPPAATTPAPTTQATENPPLTQVPIVATPVRSESKQDRDLDRLESHWNKFLNLIDEKSLTFVGPQAKELDDMEAEMHRDGLVKRIEMVLPGTSRPFRFFWLYRDQYFQVNSLLSDPNLNHRKGLAEAEEQLEAATRQAKLILNPVATGESSNARVFMNVDRAIRNSRERLKEMDAEAKP